MPEVFCQNIHQSIIILYTLQIRSCRYQCNKNKIAEGEFLQFTMDIWKPGEGDKIKIGKCTKKTKESFPYLDMKISWSKLEKLAFYAYSKPGQAIQYVNKGSSHHRTCLNAIPSGVLKCLGKLTSEDREKKHQAVKEIYPDHIKALEKANLLLAPDFKKLIKMKDLWIRNGKEQHLRSEKNRKKV